MATTTYGTPYVSGTDLVANWPAASLTVANSIDQAGYYVGRGTNTQTGSYTLVLTDAGKNITQAVNTANTITIPTNSSVAFPIGTRVNIINLGSGACTPTAAGGVTIAGTITALAINEYVSLVKTGTNTWSYLAAPTPTAPGLSLITPTSVAGAGVSLSGASVVCSAATTASVNGVFSASYDAYAVVFTSSNVSTGLSMRLRVAGTDNSAAQYDIYGNYGGASLTNYSDLAATQWNPVLANLAYRGWHIELFNPAVATPTTALARNYESNGSTTNYALQSAWTHRASTAFDGFSIIAATGVVTTTIRTYGLRNS